MQSSTTRRTLFRPLYVPMADTVLPVSTEASDGLARALCSMIADESVPCMLEPGHAHSAGLAGAHGGHCVACKRRSR